MDPHLFKSRFINLTGVVAIILIYSAMPANDTALSALKHFRFLDIFTAPPTARTA